MLKPTAYLASAVAAVVVCLSSYSAPASARKDGAAGRQSELSNVYGPDSASRFREESRAFEESRLTTLRRRSP